MVEKSGELSSVEVSAEDQEVSKNVRLMARYENQLAEMYAAMSALRMHNMVLRLAVKYQLQAEKYTFDMDNLRFVPKETVTDGQ